MQPIGCKGKKGVESSGASPWIDLKGFFHVYENRLLGAFGSPMGLRHAFWARFVHRWRVWTLRLGLRLGHAFGGLRLDFLLWDRRASQDKPGGAGGR